MDSVEEIRKEIGAHENYKHWNLVKIIELNGNNTIMSILMGSRWESHQTQILPMRPWRHADIGGELLGDILPSGQLGVCQGHAYSGNPQRSPHQVSMFCSGLQPG